MRGGFSQLAICKLVASRRGLGPDRGLTVGPTLLIQLPTCGKRCPFISDTLRVCLANAAVSGSAQVWLAPGS